MGIPYVGFSNETLSMCPSVHAGDTIGCPTCGGEHTLEGCKDEQGKPSELLLFYKCGEKSFLGAVAGKLVMNIESDCKGGG